MKKVMIVLMFLMLAGGVLAMSDPISVRSEAGNEIKIYVYPAETGPILNSAKGIADEDGIFGKTFFSLNVDSYKLRIIVIDPSDDKIRDDRIEGLFDTNGSVSIDCVPSVCEVTDEVFEEVAEVEEVVENETVVEGESDGSGLTGNAIKDVVGSINWVYSIGGLFVLLLLVVFVVGMMHRGKGKGVEVLDDDEKELRDMESKVKETADKIQSVKEKKMRWGKIEAAKKKLAEEERELKELEAGGDDDKVERQEDVVERAEDKVDDVKDQED